MTMSIEPTMAGMSAIRQPRQISSVTLRLQKLDDFAHRFLTTCGWCGRKIPPDTEVFGGGGKARPGIDLTSHAGQVLPVYLITLDKTVLVAVTGYGQEEDRRRSREAGFDYHLTKPLAPNLLTAFVASPGGNRPAESSAAN